MKPDAKRRQGSTFPSEDVEIAVICTNLIEGVIRAVPLIQHLLDEILTCLNTETNGLFIRPPT
jgi:hypothetical protein